MGLRGPKAKPVVDRFAAKIALTDTGCIEWLAGTNGIGYGIVHLGTEDGSRKTYAHRWSYEHHNGPIPDGLHLDHLCRNTICVNPEHLEPVTQRENVLRGYGFPALNARKSHCVAGHPLTGDNLRVELGTGYRKCRACAKAREAQRAPRKHGRKAA